MSLTETLLPIRETLLTALRADDRASLAAQLPELRAADLAEILEDLIHVGDKPAALILLDELVIERRANVFSYLPGALQARLAQEIPAAELVAILQEMSGDEQADLFNSLGEDRREGLLRLMAHQEREDLKRLASYDEGTAGAVMTSDYIAIPSGLTVSQAMMRVRQTAPDAETVYQIYVLGEGGRLAGTLSLRQLIVASAGTLVNDIMIKDVIKAAVSDTQESVANLVARYDLIALPVVDADGRMIGIVTHDDAMDVQQFAATEDIHKGMSIAMLGEGMGRIRPWNLYRKRVFWLVLLVLANLFSGAGIAFFEDMIAAQIALVFFLPLLIGSGGNAGAQASTLVVRGMATGEVDMRDWGRLLGRELLVAGALGLTMALVVAPIGVLRGGVDVAMIVTLSMVSIVLFGSLLGICLPFLLQRCNIDPATASAPLVTTLIDASGVLIYFSFASALLTTL